MSARSIIQLGQIATISSGGTPSRTKPSYWGGKIPWVKTTQIQNCWIYEHDVDEWITEEGLGNSSAKMYPKGTLLMAMYGQGKTRGQVAILGLNATINQACAAIELDSKLADRDFIYQQLLYKYETIRGMSNAGGQDNLSAGIIREIDVQIPPLREQKAIADTLSTWDTAIDTMERLIAAKESARRVQVSDHVFGKARASTTTSVECVQRQYFSHPIDWEYCQIGSFGFEVSEKPMESESQLPVLSCSKYDGLVDSLEYFGKKVFSDDTSGYKVIRKGQFGYPSNHIEEGSIGLLEHRNAGLVSPIYIVFSVDADKVHPPFLHLVLKTDLYKHIFRVNTSSSVDRRGNLRWDEFSRIHVALPALVEQQQIVALVEALDAELTLLRKQLGLLKHQKRGLMQKLLTGAWRVPIPQEAP